MINSKNFTLLVTLLAVFASGVAHAASAAEQAEKYEQMKLNYSFLYEKLKERSPENKELMFSPKEMEDDVESRCEREEDLAQCRVDALRETGRNLRDQLDSAEILNIGEDQDHWNN